jgi:hypothetical protein
VQQQQQQQQQPTPKTYSSSFHFSSDKGMVLQQNFFSTREIFAIAKCSASSSSLLSFCESPWISLSLRQNVQ